MACTIFAEKWLLNNLACVWSSLFLDARILININLSCVVYRVLTIVRYLLKTTWLILFKFNMIHLWRKGNINFKFIDSRAGPKWTESVNAHNVSNFSYPLLLILRKNWLHIKSSAKITNVMSPEVGVQTLGRDQNRHMVLDAFNVF